MSLMLIYATLRNKCEQSFIARIIPLASENPHKMQFSVNTDDKMFIVTVEEVI